MRHRKAVRLVGIVWLFFVFFGITETAKAENLFFSLTDFFTQQLGTAIVTSNNFYPVDPDIGLTHRIHPSSLDPLIHIFSPRKGSKIFGLENEEVKVQSTHPDIAYDPDNQRYLVVWEERNENGSNIMGQFRNQLGNSISYPILISSPRTKRGCFYEGFDSDPRKGTITIPKNCPNAVNPAVAYNKGSDGKGRFLVVWELSGTADFATNSDGSPYPKGKKFSGIIAKMLNTEDLSPATHSDDRIEGTEKVAAWGEGILISGIWIVSNSPAGPARNDGEVQAWEQSSHPDVAPTGSNGFLVTWQTNKGFIGCDDPDRRDSSSIYARYVHPEFSPKTFFPPNLSPNKPVFPVYTDRFSAINPLDKIACAILPNVFRAEQPRIAYNNGEGVVGESDLVVAFEFARAGSPSRGDIAAQKIILSSANDARLENPECVRRLGHHYCAEYVAIAPGGSFFHNPDLISYREDLILAYDDTNNIHIRRILGSGLRELSSTILGLPGNEDKTNPRLSSGLGIAGRPSSGEGGIDLIALSYLQNSSLYATVVDRDFRFMKIPFLVSGSLPNNRLTELVGDFSDFVLIWAGTAKAVEKVRAYKLIATGPNNSPYAPEPTIHPADGVTWAPTRLYLSWEAPGDPDGDAVEYQIYFSEVSSDPKVFPQPTLYRNNNILDPKFVIQASTDGRAEYLPDIAIPERDKYLRPNKSYAWQICARDSQGELSICSEPRRFNTDDSVVGWWRFDEGNGTVAKDSSGKGNDGLLRNSPIWTDGISGKALQFDGEDDYVFIGDKSNLEGMETLSVEAWVKTTMTKMNRAIVAKWWGGITSYSYIIGTSGYKFVFATQTTDEVNLTSVALLNDGNWHHVIGTYNGTLQKAYIDRVMESSIPQKGLIANSETEVCIGDFCNKGNGQGQGFDGLIDEVVIYSRAISDEMITNKNCADQILAGLMGCAP